MIYSFLWKIFRPENGEAKSVFLHVQTMFVFIVRHSIVIPNYRVGMQSQVCLRDGTKWNIWVEYG